MSRPTVRSTGENLPFRFEPWGVRVVSAVSLIMGDGHTHRGYHSKVVDLLEVGGLAL